MPLARAILALVYGSHKQGLEPDADPAEMVRGVSGRLGRKRARRLLVGAVGALAAAAVGFVAAPRPTPGDREQSSGPPAAQVVSSWETGTYSADLIISDAASGGSSLYAYEEDDSGDDSTRYKIFAVGIPDGHVEWSLAIDGSGETVAMAADSGRLYVGGITEVYALSATTGRIIWTYHVLTGLNSGPVASGNYVYVTDLSGDVIALNARTGKEAWLRGLGADVKLGSPTFSDGSLYVASGDVTTEGILYAIDASDGSIRWSVSAYPAGSPLAVGDTVYVGGDEVRAFNAANGRARWSAPEMDTETDPVACNGMLLIGTDDGVVQGFDPVTGKLRISYSLPEEDFDLLDDVTCDDGTVYAEGDEGDVYGFRISDGKLEWSYSSDDSDLDGPVPVVDGIAYACDDNSLIGIRAPGSPAK
jgi:outer membrane protein assembly factor BamB